MHEQAPLALAPPAGAASWAEDTLLPVRLGEELARLNGAFAALAVDCHAQRPGMPAFGLAGHVMAGLARVPVGASLPALPFALFDIRFRDERYWKAELAACGSVHDALPAIAAEPRVRRFARGAVTLAWHMAQVAPGAARLALGLDTATLDGLAGLPVGSLDTLARRVAPAVAARFSTRERFWSLIASAMRFPGDATRLERLRWLGLQLQGAESARLQQLHRRLRRPTQE